jgi:UDP-N-acetylglucosamine 2-epimerase (non-hydrolysing)/GDP/UDP-N,N'-diacetylbacillosamine 2-epimerase (hydrolysing)
MVPMIHEFLASNFIEPFLLVTDQHLNAEFGATIEEVKSKLGGFIPIIPVKMNQNGDSAVERITSLSMMNFELAYILENLNPDFVLVYGDRGESLLAACTCLHLRVPVIHLQGGDLSGSIDEWMRHAITKLSHLHYASSNESRDRIIQLGEEPWRVFNVGDSHLDPYLLGQFETLDVLKNRYQIPVEDKIILILQHSETTEPGEAKTQMDITLEALAKFQNYRKIIIYPSSDIGYRGIIQSIQSLGQEFNSQVFMNLPSEVFRTLLKIASVIVGNSSCGLIEAPQVGTATVNIGRRQNRRPSGPSVIHCEHSTESIVDAVGRAILLKSNVPHESPYQIDDGQTVAKRITVSLSDFRHIDKEKIWIKDFFDMVKLSKTLNKSDCETSHE